MKWSVRRPDDTRKNYKKKQGIRYGADDPITPARFVTIRLAEQLTGITEKAIRRKMERGSLA